MITDLELKNFCEKNEELISKYESKSVPGLFVVKYKRKVFYKSLWTPELQELRGLVVDKDFNVVARPFTKIFNRFERNTDIHPDEDVIAVEKINGFLGCVTFDFTHGPIYSTTGSLDSPFAVLVKKHLGHLEDSPFMVSNTTMMFEVVDESDPHIIDETPGVYLIGARDTGTGEHYTEAQLDRAADMLGVMRPAWVECKFSDVVNEVRTCKHEGFVVYGKDTTLKIKSPYYLAKKLFSRVNPEKINEGWLHTAKTWVDEEYYPLVDHITENMGAFVMLSPEDRREFIDNFIFRS